MQFGTVFKNFEGYFCQLYDTNSRSKYFCAKQFIFLIYGYTFSQTFAMLPKYFAGKFCVYTIKINIFSAKIHTVSFAYIHIRKIYRAARVRLKCITLNSFNFSETLPKQYHLAVIYYKSLKQILMLQRNEFKRKLVILFSLRIVMELIIRLCVLSL